jgi:hypothetical protein
VGDVDSRRHRRRELDACLDALETAHERDEMMVSTSLGLKLQQHVPSIAPGMLVADAIEMVFQAQEGLTGEGTSYEEPSYMIGAPQGGMSRGHSLEHDLNDGASPGLLPRRRSLEGPIGVTEARRLTERIRTATRMVCLLLLDAYERKVWFALGHRNWEEYVRSDLGFRRSRAYELLDQARTIRALQQAASTAEVPDVSPYAVEQIKPHLPEVLETIRVRADEVPSERAVDVIVDVVQQRRLQVVEPQRASARRLSSPGGTDVQQLLEAIYYLADLPTFEEQWVEKDAGRIDPGELDRAVGWLAEFELTCKN